LAERLHRTIYFLGFYETKFGIIGEFFCFGHFRGERDKTLQESTAQQLNFPAIEWTEFRIFATNSKVRTTLYSIINNTLN